MRALLNVLSALLLLPACASVPSVANGDDPAALHALAVRRATGQGEAPPPLPAVPRPASYYERLSWAGLGLGIASAAAAVAVSQDPRGPGPNSNAVTGLYGLSGAFLGAGLAFTWFAHPLKNSRP
jgi:hypothetical protein